MAPKRPSPLDEPSAASSSEVEETESLSEGEEDSGSGSEDDEPESEQPKAPPKKSEAKPDNVNSKKQTQSSSSSSGSESEFDESELKNVKPIDSKPMEVTTSNTKKPRSKLAATSPARPESKRPSQTEVKNSKRAKKKGSEDTDGGVKDEEPKKSGDDSKKLFQRLWSEDDEIVILKGLFDYTAKKGIDPTVDMNDFLDFIKKSLHVEVSKTQVYDKVRRLRKKYENNASKGTKYRPTKSHDQNAFELSKKVWGDGGEVPSNGDVELRSTSNGKSSPNQKGSARSLAVVRTELHTSPIPLLKEVDKMDVDKNVGVSGGLNDLIDFGKSFGMGRLPDYVYQGLDLISESKKAELGEKWKKLHVAELEFFVKRTHLMGEQAKLILEAYHSSGH